MFGWSGLAGDFSCMVQIAGYLILEGQKPELRMWRLVQGSRADAGSVLVSSQSAPSTNLHKQQQIIKMTKISTFFVK